MDEPKKSRREEFFGWIYISAFLLMLSLSTFFHMIDDSPVAAIAVSGVFALGGIFTLVLTFVSTLRHWHRRLKADLRENARLRYQANMGQTDGPESAIPSPSITYHHDPREDSNADAHQ
jgi:hypothetical protein